MSAPAKNAELSTVVENTTKILVPSISLQSVVATKREPVFFNSAAELNRDISVVAYRSFLAKPNSGNSRKRSNSKNLRDNAVLADSLCGTGVRGLRVAVEAAEVNQIYFNDINPLAIDLAKKSSVINRVEDKCHFSVNEVCKFLLGGACCSDKLRNEELGSMSSRFTIVDLDPFGSPASYIDCVLRSVEDGGLISITATDTAVLCGKYPEVCLRKYYGLPLTNSYSNEVALRLMISLVALTSSRLGIYIRPLFAHTNMHYLRMYAQVNLSSELANSVFENLGYLQHCFYCGNRAVSNVYARSEICELCRSRFKIAGWLWTGPIYEKDFIREMISKIFQSDDNGNESRKRYFEEVLKRREKKLHKLLLKCIEEHDEIPYYFTSEEISSRLKIGSPSVTKIVEALSNAGFKASRSGLNPTAFKTDAKIHEIMALFRC